MRIGAVGIVLLCGGFLLVASGLIPVKASSGHWGITKAFLQFAKKRSVATHSMGTKAPPLDDLSLIMRGAGHYDLGCRPCHGAPHVTTPRIPLAMLPQPPVLTSRMSRWKDSELFHIVKHGIKLTGMPAWPSLHRDDEVWAVVAFLRKLPELDERQYLELIGGPHEGGVSDEEPADSLTDEGSSMVAEPQLRDLESAGIDALATCRRCHGLYGHGRGAGAFPSLAGQNAVYQYNALQAYARGERYSGIMKPIAAGLSREEMIRLSRYYARQSPSRTPIGGGVEGRIERGREIALRGTRRIPACSECHGPGVGNRNPAYPVLAGQYEEYLLLQLELFKTGKRGGSRYAHLMEEVAPNLTQEQMKDVASYYASLRPAPE